MQEDSRHAEDPQALRQCQVSTFGLIFGYYPRAVRLTILVTSLCLVSSAPSPRAQVASQAAPGDPIQRWSDACRLFLDARVFDKWLVEPEA